MEPLRFAIIGAGNIARVHAQAIALIPDARLSVVCSPTATRGQPLAEAYAAEWTSDYKVAVSRSDVDIVSICTPSGTHRDIAIAAAGAGKHLLVEKPIEITLPRVNSLIEAARAARVKLACVFPYRFRLGVQQAKEALDAGRLGQLILADAYVKWHRPQSYYDGTWRGTWALDGGGALMNQSIHSIDLVRWLAGSVESVTAHVATLSHQMETEDTAVAALVFKNGALGVIQGTTSAWPGEPARVEFRGDRGTVVLEEGRIVTWKLADAAPDEEERMLRLEERLGTGAQNPMAINVEPHRQQIADLMAAVREDRPPMIQGIEAREAVELIRAIYHSALQRQPVSLPLMDSDVPDLRSGLPLTSNPTNSSGRV